MHFGRSLFGLVLPRKMLFMGSGKAQTGLCSAGIRDSLRPSEGFAGL